MRHLRLVIIVFALLVGYSDRAHSFIELNAFYFSDALSAGSTVTNGRTNLEFAVGFAVDKKNKYLVGWGYNTMSASDATSTTSTYSSTQMGPRFVIGLDKENAWTLGLGYYLVTTASYDDGTGTAVTWKGTALKADFGYSFLAGTDWMMGIRMNYSSASYAEQLVGGTTYSAVGYTRVSMYPSIYTIYYF